MSAPHTLPLRSEIPDKYKWNLADIYPSDAAWRAAKDAFAAEIPSLGKFKGRLMSSPASLADGLDTADVGRRLFYSERTVKNIIHDVTSRLDLRNRAHAVAYAIREGLI